ncbi:pentatricopeptide repeat-containing protein 2, mitochondrial-like [Diabrotica virgifera virgifera]|uniref:Pentatricopeptide repeat-containing protein 2, mitochondrial-like n=1 Tax=Diabrotica virgifera virgifera TaxID=50390 RepID=A0A6P7GL36_DIAVI|nr:pentatricopeptide repeat-containing protein 2, mitochondrial-like [Diabrotica virgifera virgifera]
MFPNRLLLSVFKSSQCTISKVPQINNGFRFAVNIQNARPLYSKVTLGIDMFLQQCQTTGKQMENISEKFKEKMFEFSQDEGKHMVFTEDLKNMIHLSKDEKDLDLVVKMIKKFNKQNKELRFGSFVFGPVVLRLFHHYNRPDLALECFKSDELSGFFDQIISYQILLDLLYENQMYQEILDCADFIKDKQMEGMKYPRNVVVLAMAACYKLNSKESLEYALKLWQDLKDIGHFPMRRACTFCAGIAYNQGNPGIALEILTSAKNQNYTTVRNLKVACLASVGRVENAIPIMKSVLSEDTPGTQKHTFNKDTLEKVQEAVTALDNPEYAVEFNRIEQLLQKQGHIVEQTMDEQLCQEIQPPAVISERRQNKFQPRFRQPQNTQRTYTKKKSFTYQQRPGLNELV